MSAFMVSDNHIHSLVQLALHGPSDGEGGMHHWDTVYFGNPSQKVDVFNVDLLGAALIRENGLSVSARYPRDAARTMADIAAHPYRFPPAKYVSKSVGCVAGLKLLACYEYQTCEHDDWESSAVKRFCNSLRSALIASLPGYDAAPWAMEDEPRVLSHAEVAAWSSKVKGVSG